MSIFAGQNIGANEKERMKRGTRFGVVLSIAVTITLSVAFLLGGKQILGLIIGNNKAMILIGYSTSKFVCGFIQLMP